MDVDGGRNVETRRHNAALDYRVVTNNRAVPHRAVEQHRIKTHEDVVAHKAWAMHDGAMCDGSGASDRDAATSLAMDDYTVLNIGVRTDDDRLHFTIGVDFIRANHRIRPDEYVFSDKNFATQNCGGIDKRRFMHLRNVTVGIATNHADCELLLGRSSLHSWKIRAVQVLQISGSSLGYSKEPGLDLAG